MTISLKTDADYALLVPTSMGVRLTPENGQPFHSSERFTMQVTSAAAPIASALIAASAMVPGSGTGAVGLSSPYDSGVRSSLWPRGGSRDTSLPSFAA